MPWKKQTDKKKEKHQECKWQPISKITASIPAAQDQPSLPTTKTAPPRPIIIKIRPRQQESGADTIASNPAAQDLSFPITTTTTIKGQHNLETLQKSEVLLLISQHHECQQETFYAWKFWVFWFYHALTSELTAAHANMKQAIDEGKEKNISAVMKVGKAMDMAIEFLQRTYLCYHPESLVSPVEILQIINDMVAPDNSK